MTLKNSLMIAALSLSTLGACSVPHTTSIGTIKVDGYEFKLTRVQDLDPYKRVVSESFSVEVDGRQLRCFPPTVEECARVVRSNFNTEQPWHPEYNPRPPDGGLKPINDPRSIPELLEEHAKTPSNGLPETRDSN